MLSCFGIGYSDATHEDLRRGGPAPTDGVSLQEVQGKRKETVQERKMIEAAATIKVEGHVAVKQKESKEGPVFVITDVNEECDPDNSKDCAREEYDKSFDPNDAADSVLLNPPALPTLLGLGFHCTVHRLTILRPNTAM